jgi:hypothetical protein
MGVGVGVGVDVGVGIGVSVTAAAVSATSVAAISSGDGPQLMSKPLLNRRINKPHWKNLLNDISSPY